MVAKIETGKNTLGALLYNENKVKAGTAECIGASLFGREAAQLNIQEKYGRFQRLQQLNRKVKTNTVHISLNFDPSEKLGNEKLHQIATDYMERIGFADQPYLVYRHDDAAHPHLHILTTNITATGDRIDLHGIGRNQSETARKAIEIEYGLVQALGHQPREAYQLKPLIYGDQPTMASISSLVSTIVDTYKFSSLPELNAVLLHYNLTADPGAEGSRQRLHRGLNYSILGVGGQKTGISVKASRISTKPTLKKLEKVFERNRALKPDLQLALTAKIDKVLKQPGISKDGFYCSLQKDNITAIFRTSKMGQIYGLTFIDHQQKVVFNGSDLGKPYAAKAIMERLSGNASQTSHQQSKHAEENAPPFSPNNFEKTPENESHIYAPKLLKTLLDTEFELPVPAALKKRKRKKRRPLNP